MVQQRVQHFLWQKSGTYYFVRRVPKDIQEHYTSSRVVICLKTKRRDSAVKASRSIAQRIKNNPHHTFAFPRYNTTPSTNANSASAAINKWLKPRVPEGCVIHSFRHSLRDRLRAVQCPSDMIDQIGGWSTAGVGQGYGEEHTLKNAMSKMEELTATKRS